MTRIGRTMHSANNRDSRRRGAALLLIAPMMALCAALSFAPDALADDGTAQDAAPALADAVRVDTPAGGAGTDSPAADGAASDVAAEASAADADVEAGSIDAGIPADSGQAADGGDAGIADASGPADGADGDAAPRQPPAADGDGAASAEALAGAGGTLSGQGDAPSIPATMDRPTVGTRDASSAAVSWAAVDGASAYEVRWSPDGVNWTGAIADSASFDARGLDPDRRYLFQVRAIVGQGDSAVCGDWSASRAFTTPYLISYGLNGGVQAAGQRGWYRQNSATYILLAPTRNGYDFAGWYGDESLSGDAIDRILHGSAGNISLFAKWSQRDYTVTYILNGSDMFAAQNASRNPLTYVAGTGDITLASATRTGYHFAGWYLDEGLTQRIESIPAGSATDLVLYAKWLEREYAIRYVINSEADSPAANSADNPGTYRTGQEIVLADPRKNYCFFQGWFLDEDCTLRLGRIPIGCTGNIVLYAKWHDGEGDTIDIDPDHQDVVEYASGTVRVDDAVYTIGDGFVSIDMGASADPDALLSIINSLKAGQVLVLMPTQANPDGYCIAFDSLSIVDGIAIVSGSDPSYEQLLDSIELEGIADIGSATFTPADDVIVVSSPNMKASATGDLLPCLAQEVELAKLKLELEWKPISGSITIIPGFEYKITGKGDNLYVYVGIFTKLESELSFSLGKDFKKKLGHVSIPLQAPFMSLDYTIYFVGGAEGSATLKISSTATLGFEYKNGETGPVGNFKAGVDDVAECEKGVDVKVGQDGSFSLNFFGGALVDVSLGTGVKASITPTIRETASETRLICIDCKPRVYAELSFGKYSKIGDLLKLKGTFSFPWLDEQDPITIHVEKKPGGSFHFVDKCTWKGGAFGGGGGGSRGETVASGKCGDRVFWRLDDGGTLTIWGNGEMWGSNPERYQLSGLPAPWDEYCDVIKHVTIGKGVTSISGFFNCKSLVSVVIPNTVIQIGDYSFDSSSLSTISIPNSVKQIGDYAFNSSSLSSITIPDSVTAIGKYAFADCIKLASITIPNSVTKIEDGTFWRSSLASVSIPNSVTSIGSWAFMYCWSLSSITIPDSVTSIGGNAFSGCPITSISIPDSVTSIGGRAFAGTKLVNYTIPRCVTVLNDYEFSACASLVSLTIPDTVISIGNYAFEHCTSLVSLIIPDSVISIGDDVFRGCTSLMSVSIPSTATLGENEFSEDLEVIVRPVGALEFQGVEADNLYIFSDLPSADCSCYSDVTLLDVIYGNNIVGNGIQPDSTDSTNLEIVESDTMNRIDESQNRYPSIFSVINDKPVVLVVFSDGTELQLTVGDSSLSQGTDVIVVVATKDDDDRVDGICPADSYHPDSALVA